ncbi:MAG: hypothetical protein AAF195_00935, partial [Pseudomonadota bacterium]
MSKEILTITDAAVDRIKHLVNISEQPALGLKVKVVKGGCSGYSYKIEYVYQAENDSGGDSAADSNTKSSDLKKVKSVGF